MNTLRSAAACLSALCLAVALVGCGAQPGTTVVKFGPDDSEDRIIEAPMSGLARLYGSSSTTPDTSANVERGDEIGFRDERASDGSGRVIAVVNGQETPISSGTVFDRTYYWKIQKED